MLLDTKTKARIGCVRYLNTLPFYHKLDTNLSESGLNVSFQKAVPTELNRLLREDKLDISIISSLEYARHADRYLLLPGFCIGADKFSESVLLISKVPLSELADKTVLLSEESLSSQILLKIILQKMKINVSFKVTPQDPEKMLQEGDACLLIGDGALFFNIPKTYYRYDLCWLWKEMTNLPFCFALWAVRRDFAKESPAAVQEFMKILQEGFELNMQDPAAMIAESELSLKKNILSYDKSFKYLSDLNFELNDSLEKALMQYFQMANEIGELAAVQPLEYFHEN